MSESTGVRSRVVDLSVSRDSGRKSVMGLGSSVRKGERVHFTLRWYLVFSESVPKEGLLRVSVVFGED